MKKILLKLIGIVIGVAFGFLLFSFFVPNKIQVEREIVINASQEEVFNFAKSLRNLSETSIWQQRDGNIKKIFKGAPDGEIGSIYRWESYIKTVGVGEQEITGLVPNERIDMELRFEKPMQSENESYFALEKMAENQTKLIWGYESKKIPIPINGFVYLQGITDDLKKDFDVSLANMKVKLEN